MMIDCTGIIMQPMIPRKTTFWRRYRSLANANPAALEPIRMIAIEPAQISVELSSSEPTGSALKRPNQLDVENPLPLRYWVSVRSELMIMKANGYSITMQITISAKNMTTAPGSLRSRRNSVGRPRPVLIRPRLPVSSGAAALPPSRVISPLPLVLTAQDPHLQEVHPEDDDQQHDAHRRPGPECPDGERLLIDVELQGGGPVARTTLGHDEDQAEQAGERAEI